MPMDDRYRIDATQTSLEILEAVSERDGATLTELTNAFDLSKTGVLKHLRTLCETGHLVRDGNTYEIGLRFLSLASQARGRIQLISVARPEVTKLAQAAGEQANVFVAEDGRGIYLFAQNVRDEETPYPAEGTIVALDETGAGKAILSQLSEGRLNELREDGKLRNDDPSDFANLEAELKTIREQDIAFDRRKNRFDQQSVGTSILGPDGTPVGAIELVGPEIRVTDKRLEEDFPGLILGTASTIEQKLRSDARSG